MYSFSTKLVGQYLISTLDSQLTIYLITKQDQLSISVSNIFTLNYDVLNRNHENYFIGSYNECMQKADSFAEIINQRQEQVRIDHEKWRQEYKKQQEIQKKEEKTKENSNNNIDDF